MQWFKQHTHGFTLIEQVVIIAIMLIFTTMAIVNFATVSTDQQFELTEQRLVNDIQKVQNYAITGTEDEQGNVGEYYGIHFVNAHEYILFSDYDVNQLFDSQDYIIDRVSIDEDVFVDAAGLTITVPVPIGNFCIAENNLEENINCTETTSLILHNDAFETQKTITLNSLTGSISTQ